MILNFLYFEDYVISKKSSMKADISFKQIFIFEIKSEITNSGLFFLLNSF